MGVDIRAFVEYYNSYYAKWYTFVEIHEFNRNYSLFQLMGNTVRFNTSLPVGIKSKGLPEDVTPRVQVKYNNDKAHACASWLTLAELNRVHYAYMALDNEPVLEISAITVMLEELNKVTESRLVFWFSF